MEILLEEELVGKLAYSPEHATELVEGYLISSGRITSVVEIQSLRVFDGREAYVFLHPSRSSTRRAKQEVSMNQQSLYQARSQLLGIQQNQQATRSFHAAAILEVGRRRVLSCEDISRHSAIDKVIGLGARENYDMTRALLLTTGRLTTTVVSKAVNCGIPVLASFTVATESGIQMAKSNGITLIGSLSEEGFWLYNEGLGKIS
jgi:FdhD protein